MRLRGDKPTATLQVGGLELRIPDSAIVDPAELRSPERTAFHTGADLDADPDPAAQLRAQVIQLTRAGTLLDVIEWMIGRAEQRLPLS